MNLIFIILYLNGIRIYNNGNMNNLWFDRFSLISSTYGLTRNNLIFGRSFIQMVHDW